MYTFKIAPPPHLARKAPPPKDTVRRDQFLRHTGRWALALGLAAAVVAFLGLVVGPPALGYRTSVMPAASGMAGSIDPGDIVVSVPRPTDQLRVGDVVTVPAPTGGQVTHRIVSLRHAANGALVVQTKGDARPDPDAWRTTITDHEVWVTAYVVPKLGQLSNAFHAVVLRYGALWLAVAGVLLLALNLLRSSDARRREDRSERRPMLHLVTTESRR